MKFSELNSLPWKEQLVKITKLYNEKEISVNDLLCPELEISKKAINSLANILSEQSIDQFELAVKLYEYAASGNNPSPMAIYTLGKIYWLRGNKDKAKDKAIELFTKVLNNEKIKGKIRRLLGKEDAYLYKLNDENKQKKLDNKINQLVENKYFRRGKYSSWEISEDTKKLIKLINDVTKLGKYEENEIILEKSLENTSWNISIEELEARKFCINNCCIPLDGGYSARSVIIALTQILNQRRNIPTVVFKIGDTHILCISNPKNQLGNAIIKTIKTDGTSAKVPERYEKLIKKITEKIDQKYLKEKFPNSMRRHSKKISSTKFNNAYVNDCANTLIFLNMFEVVRRGYRGENNPGEKLDKLPIAEAQARRWELLLKGEITFEQAFNEYGAVTGKNLLSNIEQVEEKINNIDKKYKDTFYKDKSIIEGARLQQEKLAEEFGDLSDDDYSDDEVEQLKKNYNVTEKKYPSPK